MQYASQEPQVGRRTTDSLRAHACNVALRVRDGIARMTERDGHDNGDASSHLVSLCGNLDQLDHVARQAIGMHPRPIPADLIELHTRISACVDAAMDLAGWAFDTKGSGFTNSASNALVKVQSLLTFLEPTGRAVASAIPPGLHSFRPKKAM